MASFKDRLEYLINSSNITQDELAIKININKFTLSRMKNGHTSIRQDVLEALSSYFKVSTDYLLGLDSSFPPRIQTKIDNITTDTRHLLDEGVPEPEVEATLDVAHQILQLKKNNPQAKNFKEAKG